MSFKLSSMGAVSEELARAIHSAWAAAAITAGMDLTGFDPVSSLAERVDWARSAGLDVAAVYGRSTTRYPQPVAEQVLQCVTFAAGNRMYPPPEFVAIDEGVPGFRRRRVGLGRIQEILRQGTAKVLLVHRIARIFRSFLVGCTLIDEMVVQAGGRAIGVADGIDTNDRLKWHVLMAMGPMGRGFGRRCRC